jgi:hypothetical protein
MLFDANTFNDKKPRDIIPQGEYRAVVTSCEKKPTKDNTGSYLAFAFTVLDGEHKDRMLWHNFNLWNKSAQAVEIAQGEMKELCVSVGILAPKDPSDFVGRTCVLTVKVAKRKDTGDPENRISAFSPDGGPGMTAARPTAAPTAPKWAANRPAA